MKVTVTQTGNFKERLADLSRRANELHGQQNIPLSELMPPKFVSAHSELSSLQELFDASPFTISSVEDFKQSQMTHGIRSSMKRPHSTPGGKCKKPR